MNVYYSEKKSYDIQLKVTAYNSEMNENVEMVTRDFTIYVRPNVPPTNLWVFAKTEINNNVDYSGINDFVVGKMIASDPDILDTHTFALDLSGISNVLPYSDEFELKGYTGIFYYL